jgi:hypothetical protein
MLKVDVRWASQLHLGRVVRNWGDEHVGHDGFAYEPRQLRENGKEELEDQGHSYNLNGGGMRVP